MIEMDELKRVTLEAFVRRFEIKTKNALLDNLYGPARLPLTRWQRIKRWVADWRSRFGNAWLALQGAQLSDDY